MASSQVIYGANPDAAPEESLWLLSVISNRKAKTLKGAEGIHLPKGSNTGLSALHRTSFFHPLSLVRKARTLLEPCPLASAPFPLQLSGELRNAGKSCRVWLSVGQPRR